MIRQKNTRNKNKNPPENLNKNASDAWKIGISFRGFEKAELVANEASGLFTYLIHLLNKLGLD